MKKIIKLFAFVILLIGIIPFVSATSYTKALDLWYLLVENVFGNLFLTGIGLTVMLVLIGVISRMSLLSLSIIVITFLGIFMIGYIGAMAAIPIFIAGFSYFIYSLLNYINSIR